MYKKKKEKGDTIIVSTHIVHSWLYLARLTFWHLGITPVDPSSPWRNRRWLSALSKRDGTWAAKKVRALQNLAMKNPSESIYIYIYIHLFRYIIFYKNCDFSYCHDFSRWRETVLICIVYFVALPVPWARLWPSDQIQIHLCRWDPASSGAGLLMKQLRG